MHTPSPLTPHPLTPSPQGEGDESPQQEDAPPVPAYREPSPSPDPRGGEWEEGDEDEGQAAVMKYDFTGEYVCVCVTVRTSDSMFQVSFVLFSIHTQLWTSPLPRPSPQ